MAAWAGSRPGSGPPSPLRLSQSLPALSTGSRCQSPALQRRERWQAPPLPRCAEQLPARYEGGKTASLELRRTLLRETRTREDFLGLGGDVRSLRAFLAHRYGSSVRGWRQAIAPDKQGLQPVHFAAFAAGLQRAGYKGRVRSLWRALALDSDQVGLRELEPDLAEMLDECARGLAACFPQGGVRQAWKAMRRKHAGRAAWPELRDFVLSGEQGEILPEGSAVDLRRVFEALDMSQRGSISLEDLGFLERWGHLQLGLPLHREEEPAAPQEAAQERLTPRPMAAAAAPVAEAGLPEFREFCRAKYGSPGLAWRVAIDMKGCGSVSCLEFGQACRGMGWRAAHAPLFRELCEAGGGLATLRALDPWSARSLDEFGRAVCDNYDGDMYAFWEQRLEPTRERAVRKADFAAACGAALGMSRRSAGRLFTLLDTARTGWIAITELEFVGSFESALSTLEAEEVRGSSSSSSSSSDSGSAASWDSIRDALWSPAKSTRAAQHRCLASSALMKQRWLRQSAGEGAAEARVAKSHSASLRERSELLKGPDYGYVFRNSSGFYLEGLKRLTGKSLPPGTQRAQ